MRSGPGRKRLLIAGGAGRMGRRLASFFRRRGFDVLIVDPAGAPRGFKSVEISAARDADVVVVAASLPHAAAALKSVLDQRPKGLVFDIASVKAPVAPLLEWALREGISIASAHPMFGPEVRSFRGRDLIVCDVGDPRAARLTRRLFEGAGLRIRTLPLHEHDPWVARSMGLAHLLALVAASTLAANRTPIRTLDGIGASSYRRLLALVEPLLKQQPELTLAIQRENPESARVLGTLARELEEWRRHLSSADDKGFAAKLRLTRKTLGDPRSS